jgi:hypothetical protein
MSETATSTSIAITQALQILWCLQISAIFLSTAWFIREQTGTECFLANIVLMLVPLPFLSLAWLASAISLMVIVKILAIQSGASLLALAMVWPFNRWATPFRADMLLCLLAATIAWTTSEQWLIWLK